MTGADLAAQLDELLRRNPSLSKWRIGILVHNRRQGVESLRISKNPRPGTVAKVLAILQAPPPEAFKKPPRYVPPKQPRRVSSQTRTQKAIRSALKAQQEAEQARLADPVEQAKSILRRRYSPVVSAEVVNGPRGKFVVGRKVVSQTELMDMAAAMRRAA